MEAVCFRVYGRVQGVGFRWWSRLRAEELGLAGSVRNRPDGSVELLVEGPATAIDALRRGLAAGPASARVDRIEEQAVDAVGATAFTITS